MTTDRTTPPVAIGPRGYHVDHRGQPVEGFDWKYGPPRDNLMPPQTNGERTARDLGRQYPSVWSVLFWALAVTATIMWIVCRYWEAIEGGR